MGRGFLQRWWAKLLIAVTAALTLPGNSHINAIVFPLLLLFAPGFEAATWLGFRRSGHSSFIFIVLGLSIALSPVIVYLGSLVLGFSTSTVVLSVAGLSLGLGIGTRFRQSSSGISLGPLFSNRWYKLTYALGLLVVVILSTAPYVQVQYQGTLISPSLNDWPKHFSVTWLLQETGIPPKNLFYWPFRDQNFTYYYFLHILVAAITMGSNAVLSILNAYVLVLIAGLLAFIGIVTVLAKAVVRNERAALFSALFLFGIGGLELLTGIPVTLYMIVREGWSLAALENLYNGLTCEVGPLSSLFDFYVWTPHHLAAGMVYALGLVLYRYVGQSTRLIAVTPFLLLALIGFSVYVAIPVFLSLMVLAGLALISQFNRRSGAIHWSRHVSAAAYWVIAAAVFALMSFSYLSDLFAVANAETAGVAVHVPSNGDSWKVGALFVPWLGDSPLHRLLDAPAHYLLEIGSLLLIGCAGVYICRRDILIPGKTDEREVRVQQTVNRFIVSAALISLSITLFMSSRGAILGVTCNDLRMRAILPLLIGLVVFSAGQSHLN